MDELTTSLRENATVGAKIVGKYLRGEIKGSDQIKIASMAISQLNRHEATKGNIDAIRFAVGRSISVDQKELKQYVKANLPEYCEVKRLA